MTGATKILVISSHYERPGSFTGHPVHMLSRALLGQGGEVRVLCPLSRFERPKSTAGRTEPIVGGGWTTHLDGVPVSYMPYANIPHGVSAKWDGSRLSHRLAETVRKLNWQPDVVHAHRLFPTGDAAVQLARRMDRPVVVTAHGSDVHTNPLRNKRIASRTRCVVQTADLVTTVSDDLTSRISFLGTPRLPAQTVHLGVDTSRFKPGIDRGAIRRRLGLPESGPGFISVCRLSLAKGIFDALECFKTVLELHPAAWLVFLGDGPARGELESRVKEDGLDRSVFLPGSRPNKEVPEWLGATDVFVLASYAEGLPNVVLEAMACGLPVLASNVGGTSEALADGSGILFEPGDTPSLAGAMVDLANDPDLRSRVGLAALNRARAHFSWGRVASTYMALYSELISSRNNG